MQARFEKRTWAALLLIAVICLGILVTGCGKKEEGGPVDVDLTKLGGNLLYAQVYNMVSEPDEFIGKSVRMRGFFSPYDEYDKKGNVVETRMSCFVPDAQGCCTKGIEFVPAAEMTYPEDYPEVGDEITVEGIFDVYEVYGLTRAQLLEAEVRAGK